MRGPSDLWPLARLSGRLPAQEVVERLVALGLEEAAARAYVRLSIVGPSAASEVAAALKIHRTDAYRTLLRLVDAGYATASIDRPVTFTALAPEVVFEKLEERQRQKLSELQRARSEVGPLLASLRNEPTEDALRSTFRIVKGRAEIYDVMKDMITQARTAVISLNTNPAGNASAEAAGLWARARERAAEGIDTRALVLTTPEIRPRVAAMMKGVPLLHVRHIETPNPMRFFLVDERHLVIFAVNDSSPRLGAEGEIALMTDARDLVLSQAMLFETLWPKGVEIAALPSA